MPYRLVTCQMPTKICYRKYVPLEKQCNNYKVPWCTVELKNAKKGTKYLKIEIQILLELFFIELEKNVNF